MSKISFYFGVLTFCIGEQDKKKTSVISSCLLTVCVFFSVRINSSTEEAMCQVQSQLLTFKNTFFFLVVVSPLHLALFFVYAHTFAENHLEFVLCMVVAYYFLFFSLFVVKSVCLLQTDEWRNVPACAIYSGHLCAILLATGVTASTKQ